MVVLGNGFVSLSSFVHTMAVQQLKLAVGNSSIPTRGSSSRVVGSSSCNIIIIFKKLLKEPNSTQ